MRTRGLCLIGLVTVTLPLQSGCLRGPGDGADAPKSIESACRDVCALQSCAEGVELEAEALAQCGENCAGELDRAEEISVACGDAYRDYIDCLDALDCEAYVAQEFEGEAGDCRTAAQLLSEACAAP